VDFFNSSLILVGPCLWQDHGFARQCFFFLIQLMRTCFLIALAILFPYWLNTSTPCDLNTSIRCVFVQAIDDLRLFDTFRFGIHGADYAHSALRPQRSKGLVTKAYDSCFCSMEYNLVSVDALFICCPVYAQLRINSATTTPVSDGIKQVALLTFIDRFESIATLMSTFNLAHPCFSRDTAPTAQTSLQEEGVQVVHCPCDISQTQ
jgi:hypothetical protein